jgi:RHS repeat-associated protein
LEPAKFGNRLTSATVGAAAENFSYDAHGNMVRMPHLGGAANVPNVTWNFLDVTRKLDLGGGGTAYYVYDISGVRVRKVIERSPSLVQERLYLGPMLEIFRRHQSGQVKLERESLHVLDDQNRAAIVETRTIDVDGSDKAPEQVQRYQLSSHLKSATVEVDKDAKILTYEEYSPYGSTTYVGTLSTLDLPKRYRFTGKERDHESGLSYHGARYYAPWLARWTSGDPGGLVDGVNLYAYARLNPISYIDPGGKASERPKLVIPDVKLTYPTMAGPKPMKPNLGPTQQLQLKPLEPSKKAEADPRYQLIMPSLGPSGIQLKPFFVYTLKGDKPQPEPGPQPDLSYHIQPPEGNDGHKQESTFGFDPNPPQSSQPAKAAKTGEPEEQNNPLHPEGKLYENKASKGVSGVSVAANTNPGVEAKVSIRDTVDIQAKASYPKQQGTFRLGDIPDQSVSADSFQGSGTGGNRTFQSFLSELIPVDSRYFIKISINYTIKRLKTII